MLDCGVRVIVEGRDLPGRQCGGHRAVHVALQVGRDPEDAVPADAVSAIWATEVEVLPRNGALDLRGPAVQGPRGERFL